MNRVLHTSRIGGCLGAESVVMYPVRGLIRANTLAERLAEYAISHFNIIKKKPLVIVSDALHPGSGSDKLQVLENAGRHWRKETSLGCPFLMEEYCVSPLNVKYPKDPEATLCIGVAR
ncbi:MAG: hypothetical protein HQM09_17025 [Candidatus Riflebacteria bacterium]|nr:hypothetical protein [Candidatus Riflebacteria bacterium]